VSHHCFPVIASLASLLSVMPNQCSSHHYVSVIASLLVHTTAVLATYLDLLRVGGRTHGISQTRKLGPHIPSCCQNSRSSPNHSHSGSPRILLQDNASEPTPQTRPAGTDQVHSPFAAGDNTTQAGSRRPLTIQPSSTLEPWL
jgi:hypothetical protein